MGFFTILLQIILACIATDYFLTLLKRSKLSTKRQPPGPLPLPIVGNLLSLNINKPHKSLAELSKAHGPTMLLRLGLQRVLVVSSASVARDVLGSDDDALSGCHGVRSPDARRRVLFKEICTRLVFAKDRVDASEGVRRKALQQLICYVQICSKTGEVVNIRQATFVSVVNTLANTFFSLDLSDHGLHYSTKLKDLVSSTLEELKCFDIADFFPVLKMVTRQHNQMRVKGYVESMSCIIDRIIKQRLQLRKSAFAVTMQDNDILDALLDLSLDSKSELNQTDIPHLLIDLFIAEADTISSMIEWTMTELLRNPEKMQKAQAELEKVIGKDNKVEEANFPRLPYLRAVVKETFRLHPPTPFLLPKKTLTDTKVGEFTVPKNTKVLVNVWAIGRDPEVWENADTFEPDRFLLDATSNDSRGQDFESSPFELGSRTCVEMQMGSRIVYTMVGNLIHSVNWMLEDGMKAEEIDVNDKLGFNLQKAKPICGVPVLKNRLLRSYTY